MPLADPAPEARPPVGPPTAGRPGALVISLDFELLWGVRDLFPPGGGAYAAHLRGARAAVPAMLDLFARYDVRATWSTVGLLFAEGPADRARFDPTVRPAYADAGLDPYAEAVGEGEADDPLHHAPGLVDAILAAPGQELGTHTYGHIYALEPGMTAEAFRADLASAVAIARHRGATVRSVVFPRNQVDARLLPALREAGLVAYRGTPAAWMYRAEAFGAEGLLKRAARLLDAHLPLTDLTAGWDDLDAADGLVNVRGTAFLRPLSGRVAADRLHTRRLLGGLTAAAERGRIFHLWWHPHNFGVRTAEHLDRLEQILDRFATLRRLTGMTSETMESAALAVLGPAPATRGPSPPARRP